jgi:serine protease inhibitor
MLRDGANGNTYNEISKTLGESSLSGSLNVLNGISITNVLFIKEGFKNIISNDYISKINGKYDADIIFDELKTPDVINNWVDKKTYQMISRLLDNVSDNLILGMANAVAINVNWDEKFNCNFTKPGVFTKYTDDTVKVAMMNEVSSNGELTYVSNDKAVGIVKPYLKYDRLTGTKPSPDSDYIQLEYIGIIPNENIKKYINDFSGEELNSLLKSSKISNSKQHINLSLPRYSYEYSIDNMKKLLSNLGMNDMFYPGKSDLSKMTLDNSTNLYVETSIHKAKIELNEKGTKAGAVTYIGIDYAGPAIDKPKTIKISFNKPFIYIIREKESSNILFFGVVYEPEIWDDKTVGCMNEN